MKKSLRFALLPIALAFLAGAFSFPYIAPLLTTTQVQSATALMGLDMTDTEIDSLLPNLEDAKESFAALRKNEIPNSLRPALQFNPIPTGFEVPTGQDKIEFGKLETVHLPKDREQLAFYTVRELADLIRTQKITSVELTKFFLARLKKYDPTLHCVITFTEELALDQAAKADAEIEKGNYKGILHGIPYGAKDLLATRQYKTTWGAAPFKEQSFDYDATVIQKLEEAGAILVAKLSMGALAWGDVWFGAKTRNPWDPTTGSSGSSAGSASAVSAGLLPFAIGTETLGSIVSPSTVCGTTGLRPTFGRVSKFGAMALSWSMDKIGPICRSAEDCAAVFAAIAGADGKDPSVIEAPIQYAANLANPKMLKVGYHKSAFDRNYPFKAQDSMALQTLRNLGYQLIPIELPKMPNIGLILSVEAAAAFDELTRTGKDDQLVRQIRNAWPNVFRAARFVPAVEYVQANRLRTQLKEDMTSIFEEVDLYVHPSWASSSLRITNYTGHPCVVVPNGFREDGKPTSITFTGQLFDEGKILALAAAFQKATAWDDKHPNLDK